MLVTIQEGVGSDGYDAEICRSCVGSYMLYRIFLAKFESGRLDTDLHQILSSFELSHEVGDLLKTISRRIGTKAGGKLVLFAGGQILEDPSKPLQQLQEVCGREISYVVRQVCALEAAIGFWRALKEGTSDHMHATVTDAIASLTFGYESSTRAWKVSNLPSKSAEFDLRPISLTRAWKVSPCQAACRI